MVDCRISINVKSQILVNLRKTHGFDDQGIKGDHQEAESSLEEFI